MGKPKRSPKTGGRQKGTPNKAPLFADTLNGLGFDIASEAVRLFPELPADLKLKMLQFLALYVQPQVKAIDAVVEPSVSDIVDDDSDSTADLLKLVSDDTQG